ncbi:MAG: hypothetical protein DRN12_04595 [Thermoplasmata archaeon]|nr:MAG: hypothetical protein DRN12_04595 [Thermoplasmata archaeon]HEC89514.1 hypothetical protein [Thermoplasmatales archaeon]
MKSLKIITGIATYLIVIWIYLVFTYLVDPAKSKAKEYIKIESKIYSTLPYTAYKIYTRASVTPGILLVATVRMAFLPDGTYSRILRSMENLIENEVKEK